MRVYLKTYSPAYYRANKAEVNKRGVVINKRRRHDRYAEIQSLKANLCTDCGKSFPYYVMDFDHRDPTTKFRDIADMVKRMVAWETVLAEIAKCDLVCTCCHRLRTYHGNNSYKARRFKHQKLILDVLKSSTPCLDCGETFKACQMDFDHVGDDKVANIAQLVGGPTEALVCEIAKCHLVCANCHRVRGNTGIRPEASAHAHSLVQRFREIEAATQVPSDQRFVPFPKPELLGKLPDKELATMTGISREMVAWHRRKAGSLGYQANRTQVWESLVGTITDTKVAQVGGVTRAAVTNYRNRRGVPSYRARKLEAV